MPPSPSPVPCCQSGPAETFATDGACRRRARCSRCGLERELLGVFEHGHRLLAGDVWKTVEVLVETKAAFEIGEQAVHRHAGALETGCPAKALRINPDRHFRRIIQWQARFHVRVNLAESCSLSVGNFGWRWPGLKRQPKFPTDNEQDSAKL